MIPVSYELEPGFPDTSRGIMPPRIFRCSCGHKLKFGAVNCGKCYEPARIYNQTSFWWTTIVVSLVLAYLALW